MTGTETQALAIQQAPSLSIALAYGDPERLGAMQKFSQTMAQSGMLPEHFNTWQKVFVGLVMADSLGIHPMAVFQTGYVVRGKLGCEVKLMIALAKRTGELEDFQVGGDATKAWVIVKRRGMTAHRDELTYQDAVDARWNVEPHKKQDGTIEWREKPAWKSRKTMLMWRVVGRALRFIFPDAILGLYLFDELNVPTRVDGAGDLVADAELIRETEAAEKPPEAKVEDVAKPEPPTDEQRARVSQLFNLKGKDGKPYCTPADRKKWSSEIAARNTSATYATAILALEAAVDQATMREQEQELAKEADSKPAAKGALQF